MVNSITNSRAIGFGLDRFSRRALLAERFISRYINQQSKSTLVTSKTSAPLVSLNQIAVLARTLQKIFAPGDLDILESQILDGSIPTQFTLNQESYQMNRFEEALEELSKTDSVKLSSTVRKLFPNYTQDAYRKICLSTVLWRAAITVTLIVQSGKLLNSPSSGKQPHMLRLEDNFALATRLIWPDDWSNHGVPIAISELHQISIDVARFQNQALLEFLYQLEKSSSDSEYMHSVFVENDPPTWLKEQALRSAQTPVLVQGFAPASVRQPDLRPKKINVNIQSNP